MKSDVSQSIPPTERYPDLKNLLISYVEMVSKVAYHFDELALHNGLFHFLLMPWVYPFPEGSDKDLAVQRRQQFKDLGFDGDKVSAELDDILTKDKHLRECCRTSQVLARYFGEEFVDFYAQWQRHERIAPEQLEKAYSEFEHSTYQQRFTMIAASHLYNFNADESHIDFQEFRLSKLDRAFIPMLIGEQTPYSLLHRQGVGDFFIITEQQGECVNLSQWLWNERMKAEEFARILQYFKDGVVYVDYTAPYFLPQWVNKIRREGVYFFGDLRREPYHDGGKHYHLKAEEIDTLKKWLQIAKKPEVSSRMEDRKNKLRQAIMRAGDNYENSHSRKDAASQLGDLVIALEALFSPQDKSEISFRVSLAASHILFEDDVQRGECFSFLRSMYSRRSNLFHGSYDVNAYYEGRFVTDEEVEKLSFYARSCILRLVILYLDGYEKRDDIVNTLQNGAANPSAAKPLRDQSDPDSFLQKHFPN